MSLVGKLAGKLLKNGGLTIVHADGTRETVGQGEAALTLRFNDARVTRDLLKNPRLAIGELYMDQRIDVIDGDMLDFITLVMAATPWEEGGSGNNALKKVKTSEWLAKFRRNLPGKSRRNVAHHYDIGDDLYDAFLDEDWQYSCAYFRDPSVSLEQAQRDKKAHIAAKLLLEPGQRVLDIGCGWGGMALTLHRLADVDVLGVTLSEDQLRIARRRAEEAGVADRVQFELMDYRALEGQFDRIVSVGMFEHVGKAHFGEFFATCKKLLKRDGVMLLHTIGKMGTTGQVNDPFVEKYIFPGGYLPSLTDIIGASSEVRLLHSDIETLRLHYALTIRHWYQRFMDAREAMVARYDERFCRMWEFYLAGAIGFFEHGGGCNYQVQYVRDRRTLPITRDFMEQAEARYRQMLDA